MVAGKTHVKTNLVVRSSFMMETTTSKLVWCPGEKAVEESNTQVCTLELAVLTTGSRLQLATLVTLMPPSVMEAPVEAASLVAPLLYWSQEDLPRALLLDPLPTNSRSSVAVKKCGKDNKD
jgi:hypothetical protein